MARISICQVFPSSGVCVAFEEMWWEVAGKKLCFFRSRCVRPVCLTRLATHTAVSKQRCLAFPAQDNHNWSKFAGVQRQNNYWDLWPALTVLWSWRWEDSLRLGPVALLMADKYEAASVLLCERNVGHNEEISRRYGPSSIGQIIAGLMAILPLPGFVFPKQVVNSYHCTPLIDIRSFEKHHCHFMLTNGP